MPINFTNTIPLPFNELTPARPVMPTPLPPQIQREPVGYATDPIAGDQPDYYGLMHNEIARRRKGLTKKDLVLSMLANPESTQEENERIAKDFNNAWHRRISYRPPGN